MTLVEFLLARLDDDECVAKAATIPAHDGPNAHQPHPELSAWRYVQDGEVEYVSTPEMLAHNHEPYQVTADSEGILPAVSESVGPHIARHDPARVLRRVAAERRIIALVESTDVPGWGDTHGEMVKVLRFLALPYAGHHPDYQEEWKP
jgi:hypothetical protein